MKKRLFNIHKLIGINVVLFFFISMFFGILTIYQPYIKMWEDSKEYIKKVSIENINLDKCVNEVSKRTYFGQDGKKVRKDIIKLNLPSKEVKATNLIRVRNRPNFYLDPNTCKRVRPNNFSISKLFDKIHTGKIFNSLLIKIIFGFMCVAVVFLCLSGLYLIIKNQYRNNKTKTLKGFYAKYHRLLLLYTLPIVFMFGLSGALFNLGVYSSPIITKFLTHGKTANILKVERNILVDPDLKAKKPTKKTSTMKLNELYKIAKKILNDVTFYSMQIYNYKDKNQKVKFIGYEPKNIFISSMVNESYIVLDGISGKTISIKKAKEGSFAEKTLDSIFYLHYLRTFQDFPRVIFSFICIIILIGLSYSITLWLERSKKNKFTFKVLKPLCFSVMLGSILSASLILALNWILPKKYLLIHIKDMIFYTQEILFYFVYLIVLIFIILKNDLFKVTKISFLFSAVFLLIAVISNNYVKYDLVTLFNKGYYEIFFINIVFLILAFLLFLSAFKLKNKYFAFDRV